MKECIFSITSIWIQTRRNDFYRKLWDSSRCNHHFSYNDLWNVFNKEAQRDFIKDELGD